MEWLSAVEGGVAGGAMGAIAAYVGPNAQWAVEKRRGKWERHKELVGTGTNLVNEARNNNWRLGMVTGDQRFSELRPHLSATTLALFDAATPFFTAEGRVRQQEPNAVVEHPSMNLAPKLPPENRDAKQALTALRVELDRLEKKWDLV